MSAETNTNPKITRIDLYAVKNSDYQATRVMKFPAGWTASTPAIENYVSEKTLDEIVSWLEVNGWIVRKWHNGARAFKPGTMAPIRTKSEIIKRRESLRQWPELHPNIQIHTLDLAYDL